MNPPDYTIPDIPREIEKKYLIISNEPEDSLFTLITGEVVVPKYITQIYLNDILGFSCLSIVLRDYPDVLQKISDSKIVINSETTIRFRNTDDDAYEFTLKNGRGINRQEFEIDVSAELFEAMYVQYPTKVTKVRRKLKNPFNSLNIIEIILDKIASAPAGHLLIEMEFYSEDYIPIAEQKLFSILSGLKEVSSYTDVSFDGSYTNECIANNGFPEKH